MIPSSAVKGRIGEVVEATLDHIVAQCYVLYGAPSLGTLVRVGQENFIYGVVSGVVTSSLDPSRRVIARGGDVEVEDEVYRENPQLERLLRTDVEVMVVGHIDEEGQLRQYLPPLPPRVHAFVYVCTSEDARGFAEQLEFLSLLTSARTPTTDDVLGSCLRHLASMEEDREVFLHRASQAIAVLLAGDVQRLHQILRRLS
jgi:hypothetical protein